MMTRSRPGRQEDGKTGAVKSLRMAAEAVTVVAGGASGTGLGLAIHAAQHGHRRVALVYARSAQTTHLCSAPA